MREKKACALKVVCYQIISDSINQQIIRDYPLGIFKAMERKAHKPSQRNVGNRWTYEERAYAWSSKA